MRASLILQQGPGAGRSYALDPQRQPILSMGRSSACAITVPDQRASRHHCDLRWNGRQWEVIDRGSTNGTRVNGVPIHHPVALQPRDAIGIGETTLVLLTQDELQPLPAQPSARLSGPAAQATDPRRLGPLQPIPLHTPPRQATGGYSEAAERRTSTAVQIAFWSVQVLVAAAVASLAAGAFLPWLRVTGSLSSDMESLIRGVSDIVSSFLGDDLLSVTQEVGALSGIGKLTLGLAAVGGIMLIVDIFLRRDWIVAALIYILPSVAVSAAIVTDLMSLHDLYEQVQSISLLFGVQLADVVEAFGSFVDVEVTLLPGLYLTVIGLGLLFVGGIARLVVALLARRN
jgi:pSer/pThr/pTyr-binding forkhead associated (FHA) protein